MDQSQRQWAHNRLNACIDRIDAWNASPQGSREETAHWDMLMELRPSVDAILAALLPRFEPPAPASQAMWAYRSSCLQGVGALNDEDQIAALGESSPQLSAAKWHHWVWSAAASLWHSGHYRHAVAAAAGALSTQTQAKLNRWDVADDDLMTQAFSSDDPKPGRPRLRVPGDHSNPFIRGLQQGTLNYAKGVYAIIRNPATHDLDDWDQHSALEQLSALSVLARRIDEAVLLPAPPV